jgi:hypothetical protein
MRDREAALAVVAFTFGADGCDLDSLDGYQQMCRAAAVSKGAHGVFPADGVLQLCGDGGRGGVFLLSPAGTHCLAPQLSVSDHHEDVFVGIRRDCFQVVVPMRPSRSDGLHKIQGSYTCNFVMRMVPTGSHTIKILSPFPIKNNQISRDVKSLFSGHRFVWSQVIVKVPMLQLEAELLEKELDNVRRQGTNGPGPIGRLSRPIRVRVRDNIKSLLRGQVTLSIQREEMYQSNQVED